MSVQFIIFLCLVFSLAVNSKEMRIVGGKNVDSFEFPYHASIRNSNNQQICNGAIISNRHILTTAYCLNKKYVNHATLLIYTAFSRKSNETGFIYQSESITIHPEYTGLPNPQSNNINDIAIIKVSVLMLITDFQQWAILPKLDVINGGSAVVVGSGSQADPPNNSHSYMSSANSTVLDRQHCLEKISFPLYFDQFCAFHEPGVGVGFGEGGSPLATDSYLIGLVFASYPDATGEPEIYINVFKHLDFIFKVFFN